MRRYSLLLLIVLLPLALAENVPNFPAFYWGEINASCALKTLAPNIAVRFEYNAVAISSLSLSDEGNNIFRFGGPKASDPKAMVDCSSYSETNVVLYVNSNASYALASEDCNAGEVKYLYFDFNSSQCSSLFKSASYTVNVSLPSDCNGSLSDTTMGVYYGDTELVAPQSLSGDKSASKTFTVDGYAKSVPEGATITFKLCKGSNCDKETTSFNYGENANISFSASCSALFPSSSPAQEETTQAGTSETNTTTTETQGTTDETKTESGTSQTTEEKTGETTAGTTKSEGNVTSESELPSSVLSEGKSDKIFGLPIDVWIVAAVVAVIIIVLIVRFVL